jgi:phenylalanyl-tRNA synthetase beta chain
MRLLISWVRDFVNVTAPASEIAEKLALRGFEVAEIETLDKGDAVIDFEVTANRPDCLSVLGFAREIGTLFDLPVRLPSTQKGAKIDLAVVPTGDSPHVQVTIEDADRCPRYAAAVADIKATTSPQWMTARLQAAGVRPISPVVDITNYVLLELGHPMHAFDLATLDGAEIRIRRAHAGETITTLDGQERSLDPEMLVIADRSHAQAVAGVMGGRASEVGDETKTVVFESAYFKPASVRRTSKRLGLKTEASARFERGTDINAPVVAMQRALALMQHIGAGRVNGPIVDAYPSPRASIHLDLRRDRLTHVLGLRVPEEEVVRILTGLGLSPAPSQDGWRVDVPTFRVDLLREIDLIEEVGRHYGLDRLEPLFPPMTVAAAAPDAVIVQDRALRQVMTAAGLSEAVTFGITEARAVEPFAPVTPADGTPADGANATNVVSVANPLSASFDVLRPSLIPGLVNAVAHNRRHGRRDVALFEIGARFTRSGGERRGVAIAMTGSAASPHWSGTGRDVDFFDLKGIVELVCKALDAEVAFTPAAPAFLLAGQSAGIRAGSAPAGAMGQLMPALAERAGAPRQDAILVAELDLETLRSARAIQSEHVRELPRHPSIVRDLSIVVPASLPAEIIRGTIHTAAAELAVPLTEIAFFDRYRGKGVPDASVSLSVRLTFQAPDRTLTDQDVQGAFEQILATLVRDHGAVQR